MLWDNPTQHPLEHHVAAAQTLSVLKTRHIYLVLLKCTIVPTRIFNRIYMRAAPPEWQPELGASSKVNLLLMEQLSSAWYCPRDFLYFCINEAHSHFLISAGSEKVTHKVIMSLNYVGSLCNQLLFVGLWTHGESGAYRAAQQCMALLPGPPPLLHCRVWRSYPYSYNGS